MLELAVFGSLMLMVLGALVNYGLNADASQRAMMGSFRQALSDAARTHDPNDPTPMSVSRLLIHDQHFPDPSNPFAVGSMVPTSASAGGVLRTNMLGRVFPKSVNTVPRIQMDLSGLKPGETVRCGLVPDGCTTAGLREEIFEVRRAAPQPAGEGPSPTLMDRYREVYGGSNVCTEDWCGSKEQCLAQDPQTKQCLKPVRTVIILDQCDGEILDYDGCLRQARLLVDDAFCARECAKGSSDTARCAQTCQTPIPPERRPWYARGCDTTGPGGSWVCPELDTLFRGLPGKRMGLQAGAVKDVTMDNSLARLEVGNGEDDPRDPNNPNQPPPPKPAIATTAKVDWTETSERRLVYRTGGTARIDTPVDTSMTRRKTTTWATEWPN